MKYINILIALHLVTRLALADPLPAKTISHPKSKCVVKATAGEYPIYTVYKENKAIFSPKSDGVGPVIISPSGKYIALSGGEISLIDIEKDKYEYGVVVVNCETGKIKGYRKNLPTFITKWEADDKGLHMSDFLNLSGNSGETLP